VLKHEQASRQEESEEPALVESSIAADQREQTARVVHEIERPLWGVGEEVGGVIDAEALAGWTEQTEPGA
jgi:hypothetical protein